MRKPVPPHKWVGGHTFEHEFDLRMTVNRHYLTSPPTKPKAEKNPKGSTTASSKATATEPAKQPKSQKAKRARLTPYERKERDRKEAAQRRQNRKEQGLCKDCPKRATLGHTSCADCAEKHRLTRRANR